MTTSSAAIGDSKPPVWLGPLMAAAGVFLLVYGVELSNFSLSIDEEIASFNATTATAWLSQGRWGMGLIIRMLPNFEAIPLLSTVLFGAGLLFATMRAVMDFRLTGAQAYFHAVVHAGFPLWLHIAEFNTFAAGFGFGIAAAASGAGLIVHARSIGARLLSIALLAFAFSVYQTLLIYAVLYAVLTLHARFDAGPQGGTRPSLRTLALETGRVAGWFVIALVVYWSTQWLAMKVAGVKMSYVDVYWQVDRLRADPGGSSIAIVRALADYIGGRQPMYLGWGAGVLFLTWLGFFPTAMLSADRNQRAIVGLISFWCVVLVGIAVIALPFVLSVGTLPIRAHVAWPLLAAWLASRVTVPPGPRWRLACGVALAYYAVVVCSIGASLFYTERLVRAADAALTQRLVPVMLGAVDPRAAGPIPFTLVGQFSLPAEGQIQRAGVFGTSFYEHDGGNVHRVALYMKTLGIHGFDPVWLGSRPNLIPAAHAMPAWPAPGSIRLVDGVVIVKLGAPTPSQLSPG